MQCLRRHVSTSCHGRTVSSSSWQMERYRRRVRGVLCTCSTSTQEGAPSGGGTGGEETVSVLGKAVLFAGLSFDTYGTPPPGSLTWEQHGSTWCGYASAAAARQRVGRGGVLVEVSNVVVRLQGGALMKMTRSAPECFVSLRVKGGEGSPVGLSARTTVAGGFLKGGRLNWPEEKMYIIVNTERNDYDGAPRLEVSVRSPLAQLGDTEADTELAKGELSVEDSAGKTIRAELNNKATVDARIRIIRLPPEPSLADTDTKERLETLSPMALSFAQEKEEEEDDADNNDDDSLDALQRTWASILAITSLDFSSARVLAGGDEKSSRLEQFLNRTWTAERNRGKLISLCRARGLRVDRSAYTTPDGIQRLAAEASTVLRQDMEAARGRIAPFLKTATQIESSIPTDVRAAAGIVVEALASGMSPERAVAACGIRLASHRVGRSLTSMEAGTAWNALAGGAGINLGSYERVAFLDDSEKSDTQCWVWRDVQTRSLAVVFRGTETSSWKDIATDLNAVPTPFPGGGLVHAGFYAAYTAVRPLLMAIVDAHEGWDVCVSGHSLGGALATLMAVDLKVRDGVKDVYSYTFGSPRVGDAKFVSRFDTGVRESLRFYNRRDGVAAIPNVYPYEHVSGDGVLLCRESGVPRVFFVCAAAALSSAELEEQKRQLQLMRVPLTAAVQDVQGAVDSHLEDAYFDFCLEALMKEV